LKKLIFAAIIAAAVTLPSIANAQAAAPRKELRMPAPGTVVCRPIKASETANATMGTVQLKCRNVNTSRIRDAITAIKTTMGGGAAPMTPAQMQSLQTQINSLNEELEAPIPGGGSAEPN